MASRGSALSTAAILDGAVMPLAPGVSRLPSTAARGLARVVDEQTLGLGVVCAVAVVVPGAVALSSCAMTEASWRRCCKTAPEKVDAEGDAARRLEERSRMVSGRRVWE